MNNTKGEGYSPSSTVDMIESLGFSNDVDQHTRIEMSARDLKEEKNRERPSSLHLKFNHGWKSAMIISLTTYFPHYTLSKPGEAVQIEERPSWIQCILYGMQHVLAMFSGIVIVPLITGYDSNATLFFSGIATVIFFVITGGKVPSYLGCSGSVVSVILSATGYQYQSATGLNPNTNLMQGAFLILSLVYICISFIVMIFGYRWLEFIMPPVVTGCILASIGIHLAFSAYSQISTTPFDSYMAIVTAGSIMFLSVYAPLPALRRIALLFGTVIGYAVYAICGAKDIGNRIDYSGIVSSPWVGTPSVEFNIEFHSESISLVLPVLAVLLAENLGHMKAIKSIVERPMMKYVGRAYLGDAIGCLVASLAGTIPVTTYADNIGVLSVTQVYSPLVILFAAIFAILLGFFAKFNAIVHSIPNGVMGAVALILYTIVAMTGIRIWVTNKIDFNDPRNLFVGGIPVVLATVIQKPISLGSFQLDGISVATFLSVILNQALMGYDGIRNTLGYLKRFYCQCTAR